MKILADDYKVLFSRTMRGSVTASLTKDRHVETFGQGETWVEALNNATKNHGFDRAKYITVP
jgi:hypothetical protein